MNRPSAARRNVAIVVAGSLLLALLWIFTNPMSVDAQPTEPGLVSAATYEITQPGDELVVMVTFDPGSTPASAVSGTVSYDDAELGFVSCETAGLGSCNNIDGSVRFAAISLTGWSSATDLLSIEFDSANVIHGSDLVLTLDGVYDTGAVAIENVSALDGAVAIVAQADGGLAGDVVDLGTNIGIYDLEVCAAAGDASQTWCAATNAWGAYAIDGLASANYNLTIVDPTGYYASATIADIVVSSTAVTTGVDAALSVAVDDSVDHSVDTPADPIDEVAPPADPIDDVAPPATAEGGAITGTVTNAAGLPVFGAQVCTAQPFNQGQTCVFTRADGTYMLSDLTTGNYSVTATDPARRYGDAASKYFGVVSPETRSAIDLSLPAL